MKDIGLFLLLFVLTVGPSVYLVLRYGVATSFEVPRLRLLACYLLGMGAVGLVLLYNQGLALIAERPTVVWQATLWRALLQSAIPEELFKLTALLFCARGFGEQLSPLRGLMMGATVALGFAALENVFYVFDAGFATGMLRAFTSVPAHAAMGGLMGYLLGLARESGRKAYYPAVWLVPVVAHASYNFPLMWEQAERLWAFGLSVSLLVVMVLGVQYLLAFKPAVVGASRRPPPQ